MLLTYVGLPPHSHTECIGNGAEVQDRHKRCRDQTHKEKKRR